MEELAQERKQPDQLAAPPGLTGDLRLHEFSSRIFRNTRMVRVWLPPRYDAPENSAKQYPVFYLNDGQNLFDPATAFNNVKWAVDEAADRLIRQEVIPPMIIVGIDNTQSERIREYLPYRSFSPAILRPLGTRYPTFLKDEIMPFIEERYRVAQGAQKTGLGGSSLGGLISLYAVMNLPGVFGRLLVESPSLFVANRRILRHARNVRSWPDRVYLAIGTGEAGREDKSQQVVEDVRELEHILRRAGLDGNRLRVNIADGAFHSEAEWAKRFPEALSFLFGQ